MLELAAFTLSSFCALLLVLSAILGGLLLVGIVAFFMRLVASMAGIKPGSMPAATAPQAARAAV